MLIPASVGLLGLREIAAKSYLSDNFPSLEGRDILERIASDTLEMDEMIMSETLFRRSCALSGAEQLQIYSPMFALEK